MDLWRIIPYYALMNRKRRKKDNITIKLNSLYNKDGKATQTK